MSVPGSWREEAIELLRRTAGRRFGKQKPAVDVRVSGGQRRPTHRRDQVGGRLEVVGLARDTHGVEEERAAGTALNPGELGRDQVRMKLEKHGVASLRSEEGAARKIVGKRAAVHRS